jgi:hypothetical protein
MLSHQPPRQTHRIIDVHYFARFAVVRAFDGRLVAFVVRWSGGLVFSDMLKH